MARYWFLLYFLLLTELTSGQPQPAQPKIEAPTFRPSDEVYIARQARRFLETAYYFRLNELGRPASDLSAAEKRQIMAGLLDRCFGNGNPLVVNDLDPYQRESSELPIKQYLVNVLTFYRAGDLAIGNDLTDGLHYGRIQANAAGKLFMPLYVSETLTGTYDNNRAPKKRHELRQIKEFRLEFTFDNSNCQRVFDNLKIGGIRRFAAIPSASRLLTGREDLAQMRAQEQDLNTVVDCLTEGIRRQLPAETKHILIDNFTFENRGISTEFGEALTQTLRQQLQQRTGAVVELLKRDNQTADYTVRGSFATSGDQVEIRAKLFNKQAAFERDLVSSDLPVRWVRQNQLAYESPKDPNSIRMEAAVKTVMAPQSVGDFSIELQTNRGRQGVTYHEGERMAIKLKVSKPATVRLIYVLEDGTQTLLFDNYRIDGQAVGQFIDVPGDFECSSPFGQEFLLAFATTDTFAPLETKKQNSFNVLTGELTNTVLRTVRGLRANGIIVADKVQITTRPVRF
ncbi:DUF4384 domain-containing protein [Spirosoma aureum]|uniref:DUF4384 domain-containing protein n=1 Tax=Spirosoma aureum TaxID=2692134 RepID=A0A6G9ASX8_9BACT|nr:DUF4384 domain-containing protein [Spirosoma aureum]QIP15429.1 DUF4384 domain-containing protein [Spirosoma aureum]